MSGHVTNIDELWNKRGAMRLYIDKAACLYI